MSFSVEIHFQSCVLMFESPQYDVVRVLPCMCMCARALVPVLNYTLCPTDMGEFYIYVYTGYTQKNGADSKVNNKFISHPTRAQHTPSAAATVQVFHALPAVRFSYLLYAPF
jgi:hypothetical protein